MAKFDKENYDAMELAATVHGLLHDKNLEKRKDINGFVEWVQGAIKAGKVPEPDKSAFLKKYGDGSKKTSSSARDQIVSKVNKAKNK